MSRPRGWSSCTMKALHDCRPVPSRAEPQPRLGLARRLMERQGPGGLALRQGALPVIPRDGEPVLRPLRAQWGRFRAEQRDGAEAWIADYPPVVHDLNLVMLLKERGLQRGPVGGVPGVAADAAGAPRVGSLGDPGWPCVSEERSDQQAREVPVPLSSKGSACLASARADGWTDQ